MGKLSKKQTYLVTLEIRKLLIIKHLKSNIQVFAHKKSISKCTVNTATIWTANLLHTVDFSYLNMMWFWPCIAV